MLPSQKETVPPAHFKSRVCYMNFQMFVLGILIIFSLALLCALCWPHPGLVQFTGAAKVRVLPLDIVDNSTSLCERMSSGFSLHSA